MASAKDHYDFHLGRFYEWMTGDFATAQSARQSIYEQLGLRAKSNEIAVDLGAGHGIDSISLANLGYKVLAFDFNAQLLNRLRENDHTKTISIYEIDLVDFASYVPRAELIVCMGDTIAHLTSIEQLKKVIRDCYQTLSKGGQMVLSFRDYSAELTGTSRFIPVRSDENKILTCFLEFTDEHVRVTDILYENIDGKWTSGISDYTKLRISPSLIEELLASEGFSIDRHDVIQRMHYVLASK